MDVNTALLVAQRHHVADRFAELTLSAHFERLEDPNDVEALASRLEAAPLSTAQPPKGVFSREDLTIQELYINMILIDV